MNEKKLNAPVMIAAWPGMGHVAVTACYYLIAKLEMEVLAEYASSELFDVDHVTVEAGLVKPFRYPKNQFFVWRNPNGGKDLIVFMGEAQPPHGRYDFCRKLIDYAQSRGVSKVFTFAAMATPIELSEESRVAGAATDKETLHQFLKNDVALLASGSISGMNGILLGVAAERNIPGGCLLGEMPANLIQIPYPKASVEVLKVFSRLTGTSVDLKELNLDVERMESQLTEAMRQFRLLESQESEPETGFEGETYTPDPVENGKLSPEEKARLEQLFDEARRDRSKAFELKNELDRLKVFRDYEDRFLDLFKQEDQ